jgi:hypothetical protein
MMTLGDATFGAPCALAVENDSHEAMKAPFAAALLCENIRFQAASEAYKH